MKAKNLAEAWSSPDNTRLTPKQSSFRLPVHVAAKLAALGEMYPQKTRTQLVADLLTAALADMEAGLPSFPGKYFTDDEEGKPLYEAVGAIESFRSLTNKHYIELEKELGNEAPQPFYTSKWLVSKDGE